MKNPEESEKPVTRQQLEAAKESYRKNKSRHGYAIENIPRFAKYRDELIAFKKECATQWEEERIANLEELAISLGIPGNIKLAEYIESLEKKVNDLEERISDIDWKLRD